MFLARQIQECFLQKELTLSLAESITGGHLASTLVQIPDCSNYFLGSVVAYSNEAKKVLLEVESIEAYGAVSEEVAREMAEGAKRCFGSSIALATTGIAGPSGGSAEKPVGQVSFAISGESLYSWTHRFSGERKEIIESATAHVLEKLLSYLNQK